MVLFARRKCPSSWISITTLKIITAITNFNLPPAFDPLISILLYRKDLIQIRMCDFLCLSIDCAIIS